MPADSPNDSAGVALAIGDTVKLVGVVTDINLLDTRFNDVLVTLSHPLVGTSQPVLGITGADVNTPGPKIQISCIASMLTKGA